jgi:glycosyltransferase involved in cell wall biosynthesis
MSARPRTELVRHAMKVVIYHNILWPKYKGAIFSRLFPLCKAAAIDVEFVHIAETRGPYARLGEVDLSYHEYPFRLLIKGDYDNSSSITRIWVTAKDLLQHRCDLVVLPGYESATYWMMLALCILLRRPRAVICDSTGFDRKKTAVKEFAKRLFFSHCDGFFCYGRRSMEYVSSYGISPAKIYFPCQAAALAHDYDAHVVQAAYDTPAPEAFRNPQFIFFGRLSPEKGLHDLIEAFRVVRTRVAGARLNVVGAGPLEAALRNQIIDLGLQDAVMLLGPRQLADIVPLLYRSVALVLPSHSEPWGLVVNESLSYGCPVVVSDRCGCVPELVIEGVTGYLFPARNIEKLADAMLAVIDLSKDRPATVRACLEVMSAFTPERAAAQILAGCEQIVERLA